MNARTLTILEALHRDITVVARDCIDDRIVDRRSIGLSAFDLLPDAAGFFRFGAEIHGCPAGALDVLGDVVDAGLCRNLSVHVRGRSHVHKQRLPALVLSEGACATTNDLSVFFGAGGQFGEEKTACIDVIAFGDHIH